MTCRTAALILGCGIAPIFAQTTSPLDFVTGLSEHREIREMLPSHMRQRAMQLLEERRRKIAALSGSGALAERKEYIRKRFLETLGALPERTPLNARVTGTVERDDYRIEKVIFESQPRFYVAANLYLPKRGQPPYPGILFPLGHESGAKSHEAWQQMLGSLAKKGYVALAWDPIGQGERVQLYDKDFGQAKLIRSTTEHTMAGVQCLLAGDNLARYTVWDGLRALDYLLSRPEVDGKRVGCTGNSGGGTHTAYLSALDDRIQVAAPSCYLTSWGRLLTSIGPQDAEQNLPPWLGYELDHPDFVLAFAPKPYLMLSAIRDFFSISGARETFQEAKRVYDMLGAAEKMQMFEADDGHGYTKPRRMAAYKWFARWLKGVEDNEPEPEIRQATEQELFCTTTGQVTTSLGGETVYTLNEKRVDQLRGKRAALNRAEVSRVIAYSPRAEAAPVHPYGVIDKDGYRIEKLVYESEPGILIPSVLFMPAGGGRKPAVLYVNGRGKSADAAAMEQLVKKGVAVLAIDLRGIGETRTGEATKGSDWPQYFGDYDSTMTGLLVGKPLLGMRAEDVYYGVDLLARRPDIDPQKIYAIGRGTGAVPVLHAAALDDRIRQVLLDGMLVSYDAVIRARVHRQVFENIARGALAVYDLPELAASLPPRAVWVVDATDPMGARLPLEEVRKRYPSAGERARLRRPEEEIWQVFLEMTGGR